MNDPKVYEIIENTLKIEEKEIKSYGIKASSGKVTLLAEDISEDRHFVERLAELFNDNTLSILHFYDAIEDYLP